MIRPTIVRSAAGDGVPANRRGPKARRFSESAAPRAIRAPLLLLSEALNATEDTASTDAADRQKRSQSAARPHARGQQLARLEGPGSGPSFEETEAGSRTPEANRRGGHRCEKEGEPPAAGHYRAAITSPTILRLGSAGASLVGCGTRRTAGSRDGFPAPLRGLVTSGTHSI